MGKIKDFFKFQEETKPDKNNQTENLEGFGTTGTEMTAGILDEEPLQNLTGTSGADTFDLMARRDYQVKMNLLAVKNPITSSTYEIIPGGEEKQDIEDADFIRFLLFEDMTPKFSKVLKEFLTMIEHGYCLHEMVDKIAEDPRWGRYIGIKKLGFRSQKTIENWNINKDTKELESVHQMAFGDLDVDTNIPVEYLVRCAIDDVGDNFAGISMIRPCYGPYLRKDVELKINVIGMEKWAVPTPIGTTPEAGTDQKQFENFKMALSNYTSHQSNYILKPAGYEVEIFNGKYDPEKVDKAVDSEDRRMTKAFLANFLELMKGGSNALSTDLSDFFLKGLQTLANIISDEVNEKIIKRYIDLNFGERKVYPKLAFSGIEDKPGAEFAAALASLINSGAITPDEGIETNARKRYNLPEKMEVSEDEENEDEENEDENDIKDNDDENENENENDENIEDDDGEEEKPELSERVKIALAEKIKKLKLKRS